MINDILNEADGKMDKSVEATREEFSAIRAGRANPRMSFGRFCYGQTFVRPSRRPLRGLLRMRLFS